MSASNSLKALLTGLATVAVVGTAIAQSNPPAPASPNPATGAGQQSSQNTPMGSTGTQGSTGNAAGTGASSAPGSSSGSTMGTGNTTGSSGSDMSTSTPRPARADRN